MPLDLHSESSQLLEMLANSIHDRNPQNEFIKNFSFHLNEIHLVEKWIRELKKSIEEDIGFY